MPYRIMDLSGTRDHARYLGMQLRARPEDLAGDLTRIPNELPIVFGGHSRVDIAFGCSHIFKSRPRPRLPFLPSLL